mmetsp:Transcript_104651/g.223687  ORF Transcript_104651/g.223687 Transcript_104651/m.223687 type:complete len:211 (+) Transcript_104651:232-864(+)
MQPLGVQLPTQYLPQQHMRQQWAPLVHPPPGGSTRLTASASGCSLPQQSDAGLSQAHSVSSLLTAVSDNEPCALAPPKSSQSALGSAKALYGDIDLAPPAVAQIMEIRPMAGAESPMQMPDQPGECSMGGFPIRSMDQANSSSPTWVIEEIIDFGLESGESVEEVEHFGFEVCTSAGSSSVFDWAQPVFDEVFFSGCAQSLCHDGEKDRC